MERMVQPALHIATCCAGAGVALWLVGCAMLPKEYLQVSVKKGTPFVIVNTEDSQGWGRVNHPFVRAVSDERLALTFWVVGDGGRQGTAPVAWPLYSDDHGRSWQGGDPFNWTEPPPTEIQTHVEAGGRVVGFFNKGLFFGPIVLPDGERIMHERSFDKKAGFEGWAVRYNPETQHHELGSITFHMTSDVDSVATSTTTPASSWSRITVENPAVTIGAGTIYVAAYGKQNVGDRLSSLLFVSEDRGKNYYFVSMIATPVDAPWGKDGPCEPALISVEGNELICVMRTGVGGQYDPAGVGNISQPMLLARSRDGGETWTHHKMSQIGVMPKLLRLSNGVLALLTGRPGNTLYFSTDEGRSWGREVSISPPNVGTTGYADMTEVEPGKLLIVYDMINTPLQRFWLWEPKRVNGIVGVYVDVNRRFGK